MLIITGGVAPASPVGESLGECLVRGRRSTEVNSFSCLSFPPAPQGPRHSGLQLQLAPPTPALTKAPIQASRTKRPIHQGPLGLPPPAAPCASPLVTPAARQSRGPAHDRAAEPGAPAPFFSHGWHTPATFDWPGPPAAPLDWRALPPMGGAAACRSGRRLAPAALV